MATGNEAAMITVTEGDRTWSRKVVLRLQNRIQTDLERQVEKARREVANCNDEDIDSIVDNQFDGLNCVFMESSNDLREYVKSKKPNKPEGPDAEYDQDFKKYKSFVQYSTRILYRLTEFIKDVFTQIKEFFHSLWNWIKSKMQGIDQKVTEFIEFMKTKFGGLVEFIFLKDAQ